VAITSNNFDTCHRKKPSNSRGILLPSEHLVKLWSGHCHTLLCTSGPLQYNLVYEWVTGTQSCVRMSHCDTILCTSGSLRYNLVYEWVPAVQSCVRVDHCYTILCTIGSLRYNFVYEWVTAYALVYEWGPISCSCDCVMDSTGSEY
jgi:hypothetical protein